MERKTVTLKAPSIFGFDKSKDGWTLVENAACSGTETLELVAVLREDESFVDGDTLLERAREQGNRAGQLHAEQLLRQQDEMAEWREYYLVFPGTIWRRPRGSLCVPYLVWGGERWWLGWRWLDYDWARDVRLVRFC